MKHFVVRTGLELAVLMLCISGCMRSEADADHTAALQAYIAELEVIHTAEGHFFSQNAAADVSVRVGALAEDGRQAEAFLCVTRAHRFCCRSVCLTGMLFLPAAYIRRIWMPMVWTKSSIVGSAQATAARLPAFTGLRQMAYA